MSATTESGAARYTAVVSGAAQGLGQAFAVALAARGLDIAVLDVQSADETCRLVRELGQDAFSAIGDAADAPTVERFAAQVRAHLPLVRILVNNAGISPYAAFEATDLETWHRVLRVNLDSMFLLTGRFVPDLVASGAGRIVNLTSSVVWDFHARDMVAYTTSKAAVVGFTRALAGELGPSGVTVNAIAPGIVLTPDIEDRVTSERLDAYRGRQSVKSIATPADLLSALEFLVDERSTHVTGLVVPVNGGRVVL